MSARRPFAGGAALVALAAVAALGAVPARAFVCTEAGDGPSLFWENRAVVLERSGEGAEVSADQIDAVLARSTATWTDIDCSDVSEAVGAPTTDRIAGFDWAAGAGSPENHNIVVFRNDDPNDPLDAWTHELGALAITTVTFESNEGRLLDADVEVNDAGFPFTACDPGECDPQFDLENTLTHELGHVLGLDHTDIADATMFPSAPEGDVSKRTLSDDDKSAICFIYPSAEPAQECYGIAREAPPDVRFTPTVCGSGAAAPAPAAALLGLLWVIRRRRPRS